MRDESLHGLIGMLGIQRHKEPTRGLRIEKKISEFLRDGGPKCDALADELAIVLESARIESVARSFDGARQIFNLGVIDFQRDATANRHLACVPKQPETGDIGHGVNCSGTAFLDFGERLGGVAVQARHRCRGRRQCWFSDAALLQTRRDHAGAERLGEQQEVPGLCSYVAPDTRWINEPSDGITEFHVFVANGMAADDRAARLAHFCQSAPKNLLEDFKLTLFGKGHDRKGRDRPSSHGRRSRCRTCRGSRGVLQTDRCSP